MIDKKKICGICLHEISSHTVQNFMDCIKKLLDKMEDDRLENPYFHKNQKALRLLDELLDQTSMCQEITIKKLLDKMEDDRLENPYFHKNQKALRLLDELLDQDTAYFISSNKFQLLQKITEIKKILTQES